MLNSDNQNLSSSAKPVLSIDASIARAWSLRSASCLADASRLCRQILSRHPACGEAWHLLGLLLLDQGKPAQAVGHLKRAIAEEPHQPLHYNNLAVVLNQLQSYKSAAACLELALEISPDYQDAKCNLGLSNYHLGRLTRAADCFSEILRHNPKHQAALANLGMTRLSQQDYVAAAEAYEKAIALASSQPDWHRNLGAAYMRLNRFDQAAGCFRQALAQDPDNANCHVNLGIALRAVGDLHGSIESLESALSFDPEHSEAIANLVVGLEQTCQWHKLALLYPSLNRSTRRALDQGHVPDEDPMLNIRRSSDLAFNRSVAEAWSRKIEQRALRVMPRFTHLRQGPMDRRLTVGYLSYDFRNHPVAHQLYPLFSGHDRNRFRVMAFSMGPDDGSAFRRQIHQGCDEFNDISTLGLQQAARLIHGRRPDILVDLMGHTHHNRLALLSLRCAPVQVSYLGFLATSGCSAIDYVVADSVVVPPEHSKFYSEKLIRMPHCYQMNHSDLMVDEAGDRRENWGLPEQGFVFSCFNNAYKVDGVVFKIWMEILSHVPGSVLWLYGAQAGAAEQMRSAAHKSGIDPQRLVFADKIPLQAHLKRLGLADLALDTLRYNGGATTANALEVGLPVITVLGRHWVSRMSASHLIAAGLPDLVFDDPASYAQAAIALARDSKRLASIRQRLTQNRMTHPLFDARRFVRDLESGYQLIWRRYLDGREPDDINIPSTNGAAHE